MEMVYFIADTHFGHTNIIKYSNRPFIDTDDMASKLIANWNSVVDKLDIVYHLGDFSFKGTTYARSICRRLNGYKILLLGNHDRWCKNWYDIGFDEIYNEPIVYYCAPGDRPILLSHRPVDESQLDAYMYNIHGHTHGNDYHEEVSKPCDKHIAYR